ncbi:MAG: LuxR family transcriptional regulator [Muribaculaceae bacterium]|nr:LuxR family transcriptional regulator [Muribaculaceae bacterium]
MRSRFLVLLAVMVAGIVACSRSESHYRNVIDAAEAVMLTDKDSALSMLEAVEPTELTHDSLRAKYHYLRAWGHLGRQMSMISDSLISFAYDYYQGRDLVRAVRSGTAKAWYKFWVGDTPGAIALFDSLIGRQNVPDSLLVQALRARVLLGASEYQGEELIPLAKRLLSIESDSLRQMEARYMLVGAFENAGEMDSALVMCDELIDDARIHRRGDKQFYFELEKAQILSELGRNSESDSVVDRIFLYSAPDNGAADYLHMLYAMNALNTGNTGRASREIAMADSFATIFRNEDDVYYKSYSNLLHTMIDFKENGRMRLAHVNGLNNRQRERFNRMEASQWESERGALVQQRRALELKAESQRKTVIILIIAIISVLLLAGAALIIRQRRQRELENEERAEALQKMVDELESASCAQPSDEKTPALRRAMLQQLGIIKMVAETPTEQNREMLRKISSIEGETNGELVNWKNVYELIDNLYSNFYSKLHEKYGDVLSSREEQIIVLLTAGFSTKEISVISGQATSTVYVRKSSIRKKLGVPEKEDIAIFLRSELSH